MTIQTARTLEQVKHTIEAYTRLLAHALDIVSDVPFYESTQNEENAALSVEGDVVTLSWVEHESDYYGSGYTRTRSAVISTEAILSSTADLVALRKRVKAEEREKNERLREAQAAVERDRREAHDRAEWARLSQKYDSGEMKDFWRDVIGAAILEAK